MLTNQSRFAVMLAEVDFVQFSYRTTDPSHTVSSRTLAETETRYAQIEKEMLSIVHACKKFHCYIFWKPVTINIDHKPLEMIAKKPLPSAPMRQQSMLLRLQWYDLNIQYRRGEDMQLPDTLSRAYLPRYSFRIGQLGAYFNAGLSIRL